MVLYFAYGSNLDEAQMAIRCHEPTNKGVAFLDNYRFVFSGVSPLRENMGVASIRHAPGQKCAGLLWEITDADLVALDAREGYPVRYQRKIVSLKNTEGVSCEAWLYFKEDEIPLNPPCDAYYQQVLKAYETHDFELAIVQSAYQEAMAFIKN